MKKMDANIRNTFKKYGVTIDYLQELILQSQITLA